MIDPNGIPVIDGDPDALDAHAAELVTTGAAFADTGARIHAGWQALAPVYLAPEVDQLLAATGPVQQVSASVGEDVQLVGGALAEYSVAMRDARLRLDALRTDASALVGEVDGRAPDAGQAERSAELSSAVTVAMADFDHAQRRCAATINSLYADGPAQVLGFAHPAQAEQQALTDAAQIMGILGATGFVSPEALLAENGELERLTAQYPQLRDVLARAVAHSAQDENYAAALVNALGPREVRTLADLTNTFGIAQDKGLIQGDAYAGFVVPFATILAAADRSGRLNPDVRAAVLDTDATDEPGGEGGLENIGYAQQLVDMRFRSLALLVGAGDFSPQTTAAIANAVIQEGPVGPSSAKDFNGFIDKQFLGEHRHLASNEWAVLAALREDDQAANIFYRTDRDDVEGVYENLYLINGHPGSDLASQRLSITVEEARGYGDQLLADTLRGGIQHWPLASGTAFAPETVSLVSQTVFAAGAEGIEAADPVRRVLAEVTTPYTRDLAIVAAGEGPRRLPSRLPGVTIEHVQAFVQEVSGSEEARIVLGQNGAALVNLEIADASNDIAIGESTAFGAGADLSAAYYRTIGEGWNQLQLDRLEQREALVNGWRTVTDPVVDLVSGKFIERIPVVNAASAVPGVGDLLDEATGTINDSINTAIYDRLIPAPELESMSTWRDAVEPEVHEAVVTALYENPAARESFLARGQAEPEDAALLAEFTADGELTLEEFQSLSDVRDAVHTYGGDVLTRLQAEAAFDKVSVLQEETADGEGG